MQLLVPRRGAIELMVAGLACTSFLQETNRGSAAVIDPCWADFICRCTPQAWREAIASTPNQPFFYRGAEPSRISEDSPQVHHPPSDLQLPATYDYNENALRYFEQLENSLSQLEGQDTFLAKPSTGHIVTTDPLEAGKWGPVVSVWPMGDYLSYVWPRDRAVFWENVTGEDVKSSNPRTETPTTTRTEATKNEELAKNRLQINQQLPRTLTGMKREVLFASQWKYSCPPKILGKSPTATMHQTLRPAPLETRKIFSCDWQSSFLTIPQAHDDHLRKLLGERSFGL